jgi:hypothetical protein
MIAYASEPYLPSDLPVPQHYCHRTAQENLCIRILGSPFPTLKLTLSVLLSMNLKLHAAARRYKPIPNAGAGS